MDPMDDNIPEASDRCTPSIAKYKGQLYPVRIGDSGEGWPYAPMNWPNPGDIWRWKAGQRLKKDGYIKDRYLYLPSHLLKRDASLKKYPFASKPSVEQYVQSMFPGADINAFFDSFSWEIPSLQIGHEEGSMSSGEAEESSDSDALLGAVGCKAGNTTCPSLVEAGNTPSDFMPCNICCNEQGFCRYCCCIFCCKIASSEAYDGYCYIRCETRMDKGYICGHIAHIDCGLRAFMAGTVGGSIGLDAEYYCRRCDSRTDLVPHVLKLLDVCRTLDSLDNIEKILTTGFCLLRNSKKASAQQLFHNIEAAIVKLKRGTNLEDIWSNVIIPLSTTECSSNKGVSMLEYECEDKYINTKTEAEMTFGLKLDFQIESLMREDEVDQVLLKLKKSQHCEYRVAEERLLAQMNIIESLYERLEKETSELSSKASHVDSTTLLDAVRERVEQIKGELKRFNEMKEVAKGFGKTSEYVLKKYFGVESK